MAERPAARGRFVRAGDIGSVPPGQGRCFIVDGGEIALFRQRDGRLFATQNRCPHRNGPLSDGLVGGCRVICPMHAHVFDLETGKGSAEGETLEVYPVTERDGGLVVELPAPAPESAGKE